MQKLVFFLIALALVPLVSAAILEISFGASEGNGFYDSLGLQWFFEDQSDSLTLNIDVPVFDKEYLVDFGSRDAFVFNSEFSSTGYLFRSFVPIQSEVVLSDIVGTCSFSLIAHRFGETGFERTVLKSGGNSLALQKDEFVYLFVDADEYGVCKARIVSQGGLKAVDVSLNFKLVPTAMEILTPLLRTCDEAPEDTCVTHKGVEWNFSDLVERQGCDPQIFLAGLEVVGGPVLACSEAEKQKLKDNISKIEGEKALLEQKQVPEVVSALEGVKNEVVGLREDQKTDTLDRTDFEGTVTLIVAGIVVIILFAAAYYKFRAPKQETFVGGDFLTGGGGVTQQSEQIGNVVSLDELRTKSEELKRQISEKPRGPSIKDRVLKTWMGVVDSGKKIIEKVGEQKMVLEVQGQKVVDRPSKNERLESDLRGLVPTPQELRERPVNEVVERELGSIPSLPKDDGDFLSDEDLEELDEQMQEEFESVVEEDVSIDAVVDGLDEDIFVEDEPEPIAGLNEAVEKQEKKDDA